VLGDFSKADQEWLGALLDAIAKAAPKLAEGDAKFGSAVAHLLTPPKPKEPKPAPGGDA
jgi:PTH1 family peptidyl-tRNA hydrolase